MEIYKYIDNVIEVSGADRVNEKLNDGYILLKAFTTTAFNGDNNETMCYALGRVNSARCLIPEA